MSRPSPVIKTDPIWFKNFYILLKSDRLIEFFPNQMQTLEERINTVVRLGIYASLVLVAYQRDYRYFSIIPVVFILTYFVYKSYKKQTPDTTNGATKSILKTSADIKKEKATWPSVNNPFMNPNIDDFGAYKDKEPAPTYFEDTEDAATLRQEIKSKFEENIFREVDDVYERNNSDRQFYTVPNTQVPSDQAKTLEFFYGGMKENCKSDVSKCEPVEDLRYRPMIFPDATQNPIVSKEQ